MLHVSSAMKVVAQVNDWLGEKKPGTLFISQRFTLVLNYCFYHTDNNPDFFPTHFAIFTSTATNCLPLGLSQLPLSMDGADFSRVGKGGSGCSLNNSPSHEQTPWGAKPPSRPPGPRDHKYILPSRVCLRSKV